MHWEYSNLSFQEHGMVTLPQFDRRIFDAETLKKRENFTLRSEVFSLKKRENFTPKCLYFR